MNRGAIIRGGLLAGLVLNVGEGLLNELVLGDVWEVAAAAIGFEQGASVIAFYVVACFLIGLVGVWMYAAVRPRLGAGPMTAVTVGLVIWFLGWFVPFAPLALGGVLPDGLVWTSLVWSIVELPLAITAGAWLYREGTGEAPAMA